LPIEDYEQSVQTSKMLEISVANTTGQEWKKCLHRQPPRRIAEDDTEIIRGLNLTVKDGEVAAIMGPNGSGKSTLSYILAGREDYEVTEGDILYNGESILEMDPAERAAKGIFLAFQYPMEIPGVATMEFLKVAMNAQRKARGEEPLKDSGLPQAREGAAAR
jgi:Fe-S cluster assembly ATP-binding protein